MSLLLAVVAQVSARECYAKESGWSFTQANMVSGNCTGFVSASGCKLIFQKQGYTFLLAAPEWKAVVYNDRSKVYFKTTVKDYIAKVTRTMTVSGFEDIDSALWVKEKSCLLNGKPAVKYVYRAKKIGAAVKAAECWFSEEITVPPAFSELSTGLNRTPRNTHMLVRLVHHHRADDIGKVMIDTTLSKKVVVPADCYSYPKNYRLTDNHMEVVMGNVAKQYIDEILKE
jgi:hypothetical protein